MKAFYSIFAILFSIFCIIYLLLYSQPDTNVSRSFSVKVSARKIVSEEHSTLSDSFILSPDQIYQKKLSAHNTFYGAIDSQRIWKIQITSKAIHKLKITFLSDTNKKLSYNTGLSKNTHIFTFSGNIKNDSQRIFIKIVNQNTISHTFTIKLVTTTDTIEKIISKNTKNTTSNPKNVTEKKQKLSTIYHRKTTLNPQFILTKQGSMHKLSLNSKKGSCSLSDFTLLNSNSSVAMVKNNKVYALQTGIAILYLQDKKNPANTSTCFVRVTK